MADLLAERECGGSFRLAEKWLLARDGGKPSGNYFRRMALGPRRASGRGARGNAEESRIARRPPRHSMNRRAREPVFEHGLKRGHGKPALARALRRGARSDSAPAEWHREARLL